MERKRTVAVQVRLSQEEADRLKNFAESKGWTMSQVLRELVRTLPTDNEKITLFG